MRRLSAGLAAGCVAVLGSVGAQDCTFQNEIDPYTMYNDLNGDSTAQRYGVCHWVLRHFVLQHRVPCPCLPDGQRTRQRGDSLTTAWDGCAARTSARATAVQTRTATSGNGPTIR